MHEGPAPSGDVSEAVNVTFKFFEHAVEPVQVEPDLTQLMELVGDRLIEFALAPAVWTSVRSQISVCSFLFADSVQLGSTTSGLTTELSQDLPFPPEPERVALKVVAVVVEHVAFPVQMFPDLVHVAGAAGVTDGFPVTGSAEPVTVNVQVLVLATRVAVIAQLGAATGAAGNGAVTIL